MGQNALSEAQLSNKWRLLCLSKGAYTIPTSQNYTFSSNTISKIPFFFRKTSFFIDSKPYRSALQAEPP